MNTRKYLTLTRAGMIEALQFKGAIFSIIIGNLVYLIMIYFLWKAIFASVDTTTVNGMTFEDTMIYLVLASALFYGNVSCMGNGKGYSIRENNIRYY